MLYYVTRLYKAHNFRKFKKDVKRADMSKSLRKHLVRLLIIIALHVVAMMYFEGLGGWQAFWLTMVTIVTVGYGDVSAATFGGQLSTIVLMFLTGIWLLAKLIGDYVDYISDKKDMIKNGIWRWKDMEKHIVLINSPESNPIQYFDRLTKEFRAHDEYSDVPIQILSASLGSSLPEELRKNSVVHYNGSGDDTDSLMAVNIDKADYVIVLSKQIAEKRFDGRTFDIIHRVRELGFKGRLIAECIDDVNRDRLLSAGADTTIRPIRAYPEMLASTITAEGSEKILENLFSKEGDSYIRVDVSLANSLWKDVITKCMDINTGLPVGYISSESNEVICNPNYSEKINAHSLFLMAKEGEINESEVKQAFGV